MKAGFKFIAAVLLALLAGFLGGLFGRGRNAAQSGTIEAPGLNIVSPKGATFFSRLKKDILYGAITVLALGTSIWIYKLGTLEAMSVHSILSVLAAGVLGVLIAECLKHQFTGKHLTSAEVFQNALVVGLLAASSSRLELLQAPTMWSHLLLINKLTATVAFSMFEAPSVRR